MLDTILLVPLAFTIFFLILIVILNIFLKNRNTSFNKRHNTLSNCFKILLLSIILLIILPSTLFLYMKRYQNPHKKSFIKNIVSKSFILQSFGLGKKLYPLKLRLTKTADIVAENDVFNGPINFLKFFKDFIHISIKFLFTDISNYTKKIAYKIKNTFIPNNKTTFSNETFF